MPAPLSLAAPKNPLVLPSVKSQSTQPIFSASFTVLPLASILSHHLRRPESQDRVFGTLFGVRDPQTGTLEVRNALGTPYVVVGGENGEGGQVKVDPDDIAKAAEANAKVHPKEVIVGWYATSPVLNSLSALLHNRYQDLTKPNTHPVIHLTLDPDTLEVKTYTSNLIGSGGRGEFGELDKTDRVFTPLAWSLKHSDAERAGVDLLTAPLLPATQTPTAPSIQTLQTPQQLPTTLQSLHTLLLRISLMLDQVLAYVREVIEGKREGDPKVAKDLLNVLAAIHVAGERNANGRGGSGDLLKDAEMKFSEDLEQHKTSVLMLSYVSSLIMTQTEIASRLNLVV